ncbi:hypothetical protein HispidOSU_003341, partial [Sigmodon hispidus]
RPWLRERHGGSPVRGRDRSRAAVAAGAGTQCRGTGRKVIPKGSGLVRVHSPFRDSGVSGHLAVGVQAPTSHTETKTKYSKLSRNASTHGKMAGSATMDTELYVPPSRLRQ